MTTVCHIISTDLGQKNLESGAIKPNESEGIRFDYTGDEDEFNNDLKKYWGYVFLSTDFELAKRYGEGMNRNGIGYLIFELNLPEDMLLPDDIDSPNSKTWQESRDEAQQVKVKGDISVEYITNIYLGDPYGNVDEIELK